MKLIVTAADSFPEEMLKSSDVNVYDLPDNFDRDEIYQILTSNNLNVARYFARMGLLHDSIRTNDIDQIAESVQSILEMPVDFITHKGKVIASVSTDPEVKNRFNKNQFISGVDAIKNYPPGTILFNPWHTNRIMSMEEVADRSAQGNYMFPIQSENSSALQFGFVMLENITYDTAEMLMPVTDYIGKMLALTFWGYEKNEYKNIFRYTTLIKQILNGDVHDDAQIKRMTEDYSPLRNAPLQLVVIQNMDIPNDSKPGDSVISELFPLGVYFTYNTASAVLIPYEENNFSPEFLEDFQRVLENNDCTAGISEPIPQMDVNFKNYFQRAHAAAITASLLDRSDRRYMYYKEASLSHVAVNLMDVPHLSGIRKSLVDVNLIKMVEMDAKKGSDYFRTLTAYWHYNHDTAKICEFLHLSKSTLFYKLNKVKEFLCQDINDYETMIQLSLGIAILESMGLVQMDNYPD